MTRPNPTLDEVELEKYGIFLFMSIIDESSCKDAIEFIIKQNLGKTKVKHLKFIICSNGGEMSPAFALIDTIKSSKIPIHTVGLGVIASAGLLLFIAGENFSLLLPFCQYVFLCIL
jgi:ATP-dependent Clp protease protease subunit